MIYCPECENQCSEAAPSCPQCGHPLAAAEVQARAVVDPKRRQGILAKARARMSRDGPGIFTALVVVDGAAAIILGFVLLLDAKSAIHEIEGLILILIGTVAITVISIYSAVISASRELLGHIDALGGELHVEEDKLDE